MTSAFLKGGCHIDVTFAPLRNGPLLVISCWSGSVGRNLMRLIRKLDDIGCDRDTWERGRLRIHLSPGGDSPLRRLPSCSPQPQRDRIILFALEELVGCPVSQLNLGVELGLVIVVVGKGAVDLSEAQMWVLSLDLLGVPLIRDAAQITISKLPWPAFIRAGPGGLGKSAGTVLWQARQSLGNLMTNTGSQCLRSASRCRCTKSAIFGYTKLWCPVLAGFGVFWGSSGFCVGSWGSAPDPGV